MKIAVIDNYDSFVFNLVRYLKTDIHAPEVEVFRNTSVDYGYLDSCDGVLLSPGPGVPSEAGELMNAIAHCVETIPIFGVCLGHQAIGQFFNDHLIPCDYPVHGKADTILRLDDSILYQNMERTLEVGRYHSWQIELTDGSELRPTAFGSDGSLMSMEHRRLPVYGVQFHPESILTPQGRTIVSNWVKTLKK